MERCNIINTLKDGTVIYKNPFSGTEAWYTPERKHRPVHTNHQNPAKLLQLQNPQNYCAFCPAHYTKTTPEKTRIELQAGEYVLIERPNPEHIFSNEAEFRCIGNLFEIISMSFWVNNFDYKLSEQQLKWKKNYLADAAGRDHVLSLLSHKLKHLGHAGDTGDEHLSALSNAFFGGAHELIVPRRHYTDTATDTSHLCATGSLTPEEHYHYFRLTCHSLASIYANNDFVKFVCVYTNWRRDAGASFEHLHRQVMGLDRFGKTIDTSIELATKDAQIYQDYVNYIAIQQNHILCENKNAVAFVDVGQPFATVAVYSKASSSLPGHSAGELRDVSDLVHAVHAAFGPDESVNEEWYYRPPHIKARIPWHVLIKWRNHRHAGIEAITSIYPDEIGPRGLKALLLPRLVDLRESGKIAHIQLGAECSDAIKLHYE